MRWTLEICGSMPYKYKSGLKSTEKHQPIFNIIVKAYSQTSLFFFYLFILFIFFFTHFVGQTQDLLSCEPEYGT